MIKVILESPFSGDVDRNIAYARRCVADSLSRGEAPIASHLLYTQPGILDDDIPEQRTAGIKAGHTWIYVADKMVVYEDYGISDGMQEGIDLADKFNVPIERRYIEIVSDRD